MIRGRCLAVVLLSNALAFAQEPGILHDQDPSRWGAPARIVQPEYPPQALERRITGYVDFEGVVTDEGTLIDIRYLPESPRAEVFVPALKEVVPHWVFYPAIGTDCMPGPQRYMTRVWFDLDGDKPKITVTRRVDARPAQDGTLKVLRSERPSFPNTMIDTTFEALVYVRAEVAPDGHVSSVAVRVYPPDEMRSDYGTAVQQAFKRWRFNPIPGEASHRRIYCSQVSYRWR